MSSETSSSEEKERSSVKPLVTFTPPDGGTKAWLAVLGGFLLQFCSFGFLNSLGIFQAQYQADNLSSYSPSTISWIFTFQLFLIFFMSQINGILIDMYGPRAVSIPAAILEVVGLATLGSCTKYYQYFLAQGVAFGIGAAGLFVPGLVTASQYFGKKRGLAVGMVACGGSVGGVVFPFVLNKLFQEVGFAAGVRWCALMIGVLLVIGNILISSPFEPKGWSKGKRSFASLSAFKRTDFVLFIIGGFLLYWGFFAPFDYLPSFAESVTSKNLALYTIAIINGASIFGRIIPNFLSDRFGALLVMTIMAYSTTVTILVIWLPVDVYKSTAGIVVFAVFYGFSSGAFVSLLTPVIVELSNGKLQELGVLLGTFMTINSFACLTGLPIQGAIEDSSGGSFTGLIIFAGVVMIAGAGFVNASWYMRRVKARSGDTVAP